MHLVHHEITQREIIDKLQVQSHFDVEQQCQLRIDFLSNTLRQSGLRTLIVGVSGGIDSTVTGRLCQLAVEQLRKENYDARFIALRLPYGLQNDALDADNALLFIDADESLEVNIKDPCDSCLEALISTGFIFHTPEQQDFIFGNIKARQRMVVQYAIAGAQQGLVVGTDHAAEALMGFFTKFGDGACDLAPLTGLTKRRIKHIGRHLHANDSLVNKKPTADLENLRPMRADEDVFGISYDQIDDFLENKIIDKDAYTTIMNSYSKSEHKRQLPITPFNHKIL